MVAPLVPLSAVRTRRQRLWVSGVYTVACGLTGLVCVAASALLGEWVGVLVTSPLLVFAYIAGRTWRECLAEDPDDPGPHR